MMKWPPYLLAMETEREEFSSAHGVSKTFSIRHIQVFILHHFLLTDALKQVGGLVSPFYGAGMYGKIKRAVFD